MASKKKVKVEISRGKYVEEQGFKKIISNLYVNEEEKSVYINDKKYNFSQIVECELNEETYNSNYGNRNLILSKKLKGVPKSKEAIEKRRMTMKEKLSNMTKEERSAMFGRTWSDEKRREFAISHRKENLSKETLERMSYSNILNRQYEYAKNLLIFKTLNDTGTVYEEDFLPISDSDFIAPQK